MIGLNTFAIWHHSDLEGIIENVVFYSVPTDLDEVKWLVENAFDIVNQDKQLYLPICESVVNRCIDWIKNKREHYVISTNRT